MDIVSVVVALAQNRSLFAHINGYNNKKNHQKRLVAMPCSGPQSKLRKALMPLLMVLRTLI